MVAIAMNKADIVKFLVEENANVNEKNLEGRSVSDFVTTPKVRMALLEGGAAKVLQNNN